MISGVYRLPFAPSPKVYVGSSNDGEDKNKLRIRWVKRKTKATIQ